LSAQNTFCLYFHPTHIAYAIYDNQEYLYTDLGVDFFDLNKDSSFHNNIQVWLKNNNELINKTYDNIHIGIYSNTFTILNDNIDNEQNIVSLVTNYNAETQDLFLLHVERDFNIYYAINKDLILLTHQYFINKNIQFGDAGLLKFCQQKISEPKCIIAQIYNNSISIVYKENDHIRYYNQFFYTTKEDMLYYILWVYNEFELDTNSFPLHIFGWIEDNAPLFGIIYNYLRNVNIGNIPFQIQTPHEYYKNHYFAHVLGLRI
jgi:hypothetical protein